MLLPINLQMQGAHVTCVGGGAVAAAKVTPMVLAGARVTVVSPDIVEDLAALVDVHDARPFAEGDLLRDPPVMLAVAATGLVDVDEMVAAEARGLGIWCLRTTGPSTVAMPAVTRRGDLTVALTTGAPSLSRALRAHLDQVIGPEWGAAATILSELRDDDEVRASLAAVDPAARRSRWRAATTAALEGVAAAEVHLILTHGGGDGPVPVSDGAG